MSSITIDKLVGRANYATWKVAAQALLQFDDTWSTIEYKVKEDGTPVTAVDPAKDQKARSRLILTMDPVCFSHIANATSAKDVWTKLAEVYEDKGLTRRIGLLRKLITTTLATCGSMETYVNDIINTAQSLSSIGFVMSEEWIAAFLLAGLPEGYRPMIMAMENSGLALTGDVVKTKLLQEQNAEAEQAFAVTSNGKNDNARGGYKVKCHNCGIFGHIAKNCRKKKIKNKTDSSGGGFLTVLSTIGKCDDNDWYFDSGATMHMTMNQRMLVNQTPSNGTVTAADGVGMKVKAVGMSSFVTADGNGTNLPVHNVQLIPELTANLLSVSQIVKKGHTVTFDKMGCVVSNNQGEVVATGSLKDDLFKLDQKMQMRSFACRTNQAELWHRRMGHLNYQSLKKLQSSCANGVNFSGEAVDDCKVCAMGKQARKKFPKCGSRAKEVLDLVHSDICGPMQVESIGKNRYFITFIDDKTRRIFLYPMKTKSEWEVTAKFEEFKNFTETQSGRKIKVLRTDNGLEYMNKKFENLLKKAGIKHETTNVHTPQQNGLAERNNRSIVEKARCMLFEAELPTKFWAEACHHSVYLLNRSPTAGTGITPEEMWTGKKPNLSHVRIFGTKVMAQVPKANRRKWDPKAIECLFVGCDENVKGYRLYDPERRTVFKSRDVDFMNEGSVLEKEPVKPSTVIIMFDDEVDASSPPTATVTSPIKSPALPKQNNSKPPQLPVLRRSKRERAPIGKYTNLIVDKKIVPRSLFPQTEENPTELCQDDSTKDTKSTEGLAGHVAPSSQLNRHSAKQHKVSMRSDRGRPTQGKYQLTLQTKTMNTRPKFSQVLPDPETVKEALNRADADEWRLAMQSEYEALMDNRTWVLVDVPTGKKPINTKWVFKTKKDVAGNIVKYKARLVGKGYAQQKGENYDETFAPVIKHSSLRYIFALAAKHNFIIEQMDAITAFLQGELPDEVYINQAEGFCDADNPKKVCKLLKAIYGLKQSSRIWNEKLNSTLISFGLCQSDYDPCLYISTVNGIVLMLTIHVDDILIISNNQVAIDDLKKKLNTVFKMKELGVVSQYLGVRITRSKGCIMLDQTAYIDEVLERFGMSDANPVSTPMNPSEKLTKEMSPQTDAEREKMSRVPYREAVGCLNYIAQSTRPDMVFSVNSLSRYNNNPGEKHWQALKHLLRYLKGTSTYCLRYQDNKEDDIIGFSDADWAGDTDKRLSVSGFTFINQGGAISWSSKRQHAIALSSCEAELYALSNATQEAVWWKGIRSQIQKDEPMTIYCDNQSTITVSNNQNWSSKLKHVDIRHKFVLEHVKKKNVKLQYINTKDQVADIFTKSLDRTKTELFRKALGVVQSQSIKI